MQIGGFSGTLKTGSVGSEEKALARNDVGVEILPYEDISGRGEKDHRAEKAVARERIRLGLMMMRLATWRAERISDWIVVVISLFFCSLFCVSSVSFDF